MPAKYLLAGSISLWLALAAAPPADARPISYPGGWTFMTMNDGDKNMLHLNHTLSSRFSLGYAGEHMRDSDTNLHALQLNYLVHRWNNPESQANLYFQPGLGVSLRDGGDSAAAYAGFAADWEDRRFYTAYENRITGASNIDESFTQKARVGIAPYVAEYGALHTWLMVEVSHTPEEDEPVSVTPLVRLFKGDHLAEAGISNRGKILFNWTYRF